ncbi:transmembrane protein 101 [Hydra vulgaris]|uniref:transmembrane protein 101 n=1 Tax=Hydra vulgaris TaxID=6087 RepID=UPI001F5E9CE3|nr:transmembrane protein 101-like [Hydra vulgaris]
MAKQMSSDKKDPLLSRDILMRPSSESACFVLTRYPYLSAILLMIITGEQSKTTDLNERKYYIYVHVGLYFVSATLMAYNLFGLKKLFALVNVFHTIIVTCLEYEPSRHGEHIAIRLLIRNFGIIGCYLMVAGGLGETNEKLLPNKNLMSFGIRIIGAFSILSAVLIWNSKEELQIYLQALPTGTLLVYAIIFPLVICGVCIYSGYHVVLTCKVLTLLLLIITLIDFAHISSNFKQSISWVSIYVTCRHIPIMGALLLVNKSY